jgi:cysteine desulfurase
MTYLDHAATTPVLPEAIAAMTAELALTGNASSLHTAGRRPRPVVVESREAVAVAFGARPSEVLFTGGGTEADNLAVKGLYWARQAEDPRRTRVLSSSIEHHAVLDPVEWLRSHEGADVELLAVDELGRVDVDNVRASIERDPASVALVTVMWANNEVGTVQPVPEIVALAHEYGIPVHTDAVQAAGQLPVDFAACGADALTLSGHKFGGPPGAGALLLSRALEPVALLHGGGQERGVRSGTLDVPAIAGLAAAAGVVACGIPARSEKIAALRDELVRRVLEVVPDALLNGDPTFDAPIEAARRLPFNAHFSFPGCEGDALLLLLDARDVECSTGSACSAGVAQPSHVLLAMGADEQRARSSLRFSLGHTSTSADIDAAVAAIGPVVERAKAARLAGRPSA